MLFRSASILIEKKLQKMQSAAKTKSNARTIKTTSGSVDSVAESGLQQQQLVDPTDDENPSSTKKIDSKVNNMKRQHEMIATDIESEIVSQPVVKKLKATEIVPLFSVQDTPMDNTSDNQIYHPVVSISQHKDTAESTKNGVINVGTSVNVSPKLPTVRVGNMDYPVHLYTIRVSNLSPDTEDMDLVDTFRPVCGAIVHARIVREKHADGNSKSLSKGYGLIQFEQLESVDKALVLDDTLGIHEKLVKVERSHIPAVSLVPPGMHRVRPKGEGKVSKRNQKRSQMRNQIDITSDSIEVKGIATIKDQPDSVDTFPVIPDNDNNTTTPKSGEADPVPRVAVEPQKRTEPRKAPSHSSITAFRPRTVHRGNQHPKPRLKFK